MLNADWLVRMMSDNRDEVFLVFKIAEDEKAFDKHNIVVNSHGSWVR